jgi:hypothetical protein
MSMVQTIEMPAAGWLRNRSFDLALICGITAVALAAAGLITILPVAAGFVLLADSWLLGYPHVVATFVRLAPDQATAARHRFLLVVLPMIILGATALVAIGGGIGVVVTIYFFWQWYHTLRQSWGISQLYRRRSTVAVRERPELTQGLFVLVALWGMLHVASKGLDFFLVPSLPMYVPQVPVWAAQTVGIFAVSGLIWWTASRLREWMAGELPIAHTLFSASHYVIFIVGYVLMGDITGGWVVTNIWHTAQYLMLVWLFNQNMVSHGSPGRKGWYFRLTRNNSAALYFTLCLVAALPVYVLLNTSQIWGPTAFLLTVIVNQTINFHHFIVDAVIWRKRRAPAGAPA